MGELAHASVDSCFRSQCWSSDLLIGTEGTTTLLRTNDSGVVIGSAEYSAYGIQFWKQGDMATPFLYNGQAGVQTDPNGLLNMRARYYSPYLCRFLNADPIGFSSGSDWFACADGNPISKSDPFGACGCSRLGDTIALWGG